MQQQPVHAVHEPPTRVLRVPRQRQLYPDVAPSPTRARSRRALAVPVALCGATVLAAAATLGAVAASSGHETKHAFVLPDRSGTLVRDTDAETRLADRLRTAERGFRAQFGDRVESTVAAAYVNPTAAEGRPSGTLVLVGAGIDTAGDPDDFVSAFDQAARRAGYQVRSIAAGDGAQGVCMSAATGASTCAWSTGDSVGELVPTGSGWSVDQLAATMRTLRADAEVTRR